MAMSSASNRRRLRRRTAFQDTAMNETALVNAPIGLPALSCDAHQHVIGAPAEFPMVSSRTYTPGHASLDNLQTLHRKFGIERAVLVQPSFYGADNSCLLQALARLGKSGRGVVVIDETTTAYNLDQMHETGVRAVRINPKGHADNTDVVSHLLQTVSERVTSRGWHVQTFLPLRTIVALRKTINALPTRLVLDHFAGASAEGIAQNGFDALCQLVESGNCYVKLSAPYQASASGPGYPEMTDLAHALIALRGDRILWGSNWPHTNPHLAAGHTALDVNPFHDVDYAGLVDLIDGWAPDQIDRRKILVENPQVLFDF